MKRIRDFFRGPRSLRLRCFRPRCLCAEDDDTGSQSDDEVYQIAVHHDACETRKPKTPSKPAGPSIQFLLPGQCDDSNSQEDLNVPEESYLKPKDEAHLDAQEATSFCDIPEFEEEPHNLTESEIKIEVKALSDPSESISHSDLPESPEHVSIQEQDPEPALEKPAETEVKAPTEEDDIPRASADGRIQRRSPVGVQDFRCCAVLGQGSFGKVLLAEYKYTQNMVAMKAIKKADIIRRVYAKRLGFEKDILQTMSNLRHPFLVNLFASFQDEHYIVFVMEYAAGGDLKYNLNRIVGSEHRVKFYAACIVLGLECLHQSKIVHRDLKLENVVLDNEGFARLTDFGLSKSGMGFGDRTKSIVGTPVYMAPEMVTKQEYTRDIDWWSFGVLIYTMLGVKMPFIANTMKKLHNQIVNGEVAYPNDWSPECVSLISQLLVKNPKWRLGSGHHGAEDVKEHRFFRNIEWRALLQKKLRPPFLPPLSGPDDVSNFDEKVTSMAPDLTPPQGPGLTEEQQELFRGFEWTAEWTP